MTLFFKKERKTRSMGNTRSCSCIQTNSSSFEIFNEKVIKSKKKTAALLDTDGNIREIKLPMKSAELMIELIGNVIIPAEELLKTRRIMALRADEELVAGKVYLLVPVSRINCKASEFEISIAERGSGKRKGNKTTKVSPVAKLTENDNGGIISVRQRRWNPVLDPIFESSWLHNGIRPTIFRPCHRIINHVMVLFLVFVWYILELNIVGLKNLLKLNKTKLKRSQFYRDQKHIYLNYGRSVDHICLGASYEVFAIWMRHSNFAASNEHIHVHILFERKHWDLSLWIFLLMIWSFFKIFYTWSIIKYKNYYFWIFWNF